MYKNSIFAVVNTLGMKRLLLTIFFVTCLFCLHAQTFTGTMKVDNFTRNDVTAYLQALDCQNTMSITLYSVKFAWLMPVTIDVTIEPIMKDGKSLTTDQVVPTNKGKRYEKYLIQHFVGNIENNSLHFSCQMGKKHLTYNGTKKK